MLDDSLFGDGCLGCMASETTRCLEMARIRSAAPAARSAAFRLQRARYMASVAAVPCDEEAPCMVGTRGSICYITRGLHARVARRDHGEGRWVWTPAEQVG